MRDRAAAFLARVPVADPLRQRPRAGAHRTTRSCRPRPRSRVTRSSVVLELTERSSFEHVPNLRARVSLLRRLGYRLAVDDLGAGYAGLTSFAALNPHVVKLDMSLVRSADSEPVKQRVIASMTALCKEFGIMVVAEGIETPAERDTVVALGCDLVQGFLLGRPMEAEAALAAHESPPARRRAGATRGPIARGLGRGRAPGASHRARAPAPDRLTVARRPDSVSSRRPGALGVRRSPTWARSHPLLPAPSS